MRIRLMMAAALLVASHAALAQDASPADADDATLRARQAALFEALVDQPSNLELMFAYAQVSMRLQDYEPAIATLERMLIFNRDLPRVKLELGVAYFRLGAFDVARFYFEDALASNPPDEVAARVAPFLQAIEERTAESSLTGFVSLGVVYSSNATLGPQDREIRVNPGAFPGSNGVALIDDGATEESDVGLRVSAVVNHRYDLKRPNDDVWLTDGVFSALRYADVESGEFDAYNLRSGPRLALDDTAFGPKARPYGEVGFVRSADAPLYRLAGGGVELSDTVSPELGVFGAFSLQYREFTESNNAFDGAYGVLSAGAAYTGVEDVLLRGAAFVEVDAVAEGETSNFELGVRMTAVRQFDPPAFEGVDAFAEPWRGSVFGQVSTRHFSEADRRIDPNTKRRDLDVRAGARLLAPVRDGWAVSLDASYFDRSSSIENFELNNFEIGVSLLKSF